MKRVAILISGGGSNMVALVSSMRGGHPARPVLVLSNVPAAAGLQRAAALGIPCSAIDHRPFGADRAAFDRAISARILASRADIVCLAGFMRILTPDFIRQFDGRILNIHPSLLPKYPGLHTHARALAAGETEAGCTVHEVTETLDQGPVLGQARVQIRQGETAASLARRVLTLEHQLYPAVLRRFANCDRTPLMLQEPEQG